MVFNLFVPERSSRGLSWQADCDSLIQLHSALDITRQSASCSPYHHILPEVSFSYLSAISRSNLFHLAITLLVFAHYSDKLKMRSPFILAGLTMCLIGFSMNISTAPDGVKYFGTYVIVMGSYASLPGVISWYIIISRVMAKANIWQSRLGNNLSGQYKRGVGMALEMSIGNLSGVVAATIYRSRDSPRFIFGRKFIFVDIRLGASADSSFFRCIWTHVRRDWIHLCADCDVHLQEDQRQTRRCRTARKRTGRESAVFVPGIAGLGRPCAWLQIHIMSRNKVMPCACHWLGIEDTSLRREKSCLSSLWNRIHMSQCCNSWLSL